jgi:hypothetical protein
MLKLPKDVKVGGAVYTIKETEKLTDHHNLFGQVTYVDCEIELEANLPRERKEQVFVHEVLHAIFFEAGYEEQEEEEIRRVGLILHQFLKDNDLSFLKENK